MIYSKQLNYLDLIIRNGKFPHAFLFYGRNKNYQTDLAKACVFRINCPGSNWQDFDRSRKRIYLFKNRQPCKR